MYNCTCKSLWIEKASPGKLGVKDKILKLVKFVHKQT